MSALQPVRNNLVNRSLSRIPLMYLTRNPLCAPGAGQRDPRDSEADGSRRASGHLLINIDGFWKGRAWNLPSRDVDE